MSRLTLIAGLVALFLNVGQDAWAATKMRGFPVRLDGTADRASPLAVDVDGDGKLELVTATRDAIHVLEVDGTPLAGFPVVLKRGQGVATGLTVGVLTPDGPPSLLFGSADGTLVALEPTGDLRVGFPVKVGSGLSGPPSLADINGDGSLEILFGTLDGHIHALDGKGKPVAGYPARVGTPVSTAVTAGRFDPKGDRVLAFGDRKGRLHVWSRPGREVKGFPYNARFTIAGQPVFGDLDDDGRFEIVFGSKDYKIHVVEPNGKSAQGFPVETGYRIYASCALADLDGNGVVDVVVASGDGKVYAFSGGGKSIRGFPVKVGGRLRGAPVVGDLDLDGRVEIAVGTDRNRLVLLRANGKNYPGFPARLRDRVDVAPLLADLTGNGLGEIVVLSKDGSLNAYRMLKKGRGTSVLAWPAEGHDSARSGVVKPNPARYVDLAVGPEAPVTSDSLSLSYRFFDMDGDPEPETQVRWFVNGKHVAALDNRRTVPASQTRKHQTWHYSLKAFEDQPAFVSPSVKVRNTPPGIPAIALGPDPARTGDELVMKTVSESQDADGDRLKYQIAWLRDRRPVAGFSRDRVAAKHSAKGQRWTVVVTPFDGEQVGLPARRSLTVANTAPSAARVELVPPRPGVTQSIDVKVVKPGKDPDGDPVSYHHRWWADGKQLNVPLTRSSLPAGMVPKHGKVKVEVTAFDGFEAGASSEVSTQVSNSLPGAPAIAILPVAARTADDLRVVLKNPASDPDRDPMRYRFSWQRKSTPYKGAHAGAAMLPASETAKAERWTVTAIAVDGEGEGPPVRAQVEIGNSPPIAPELTQPDPRPTTDKDLVLRVSGPPRDPDGDAAWLQVSWSRDGKTIAQGKDLLSLPADKTRKHGSYKARLVPSDGTDQGPAVERWFLVKNSPPSGCEVAIKPKQPGSGQVLAAEVTGKSTDRDGDRIEMRYRWFVDGRPIKPGARPEKVPAKLVKRSQRWTLVATPFDGEAEGAACKAEVTIRNRGPRPPAIAVRPERPTRLDGLSLKIDRAALDPDGDGVTLTSTWTQDGKPVIYGVGSKPVPAGALRKGQVWQVTVVASDGELESEAVRAQVVVLNSPPARAKVGIFPEKPLSSDVLRCRLTAATADPDGDSLTHAYSWTLKHRGKKKARAQKAHVEGPVLKAEYTRKGQRWECRVSASDGKLSGPAASVEVMVHNAAPSVAGVKITPEAPRADQPLRCTIATPAVDPDGDRIRYKFIWTKDGVVQKFAPETDRVPVRLTKPDDIWQCTVVASDGQLKGPPGESQEVLVLSSEP